MIFYFSGTGNSAWIAHRLAETLGDRLVNMAEGEAETYELEADERVGFVFPVYAWAPPKLVTEFIHRMKVSMPPAYLYFVCTCGDDTGKTAQVFTKAISARGWTCQAGYSVTMPNTYVSLPGFDVDDKELEKRKIQNAKARVEFIAGKLKARVRMNTYNCHEGAVPFLKTYLVRPLFDAFLMSPKPFHVTDKCIGCKRCEKVCPVHNIQVKEKPEWGHHCTQCLACYHTCPLHAVEYGTRTKGKGQYKGIPED